MKVELKKIKYAAFASQETNCFAAEVWLDGVPAFTVSNEGHGGCDMFGPIGNGKQTGAESQAQVQRLEDYAKTLPQWEAYGTKGDMTADILIDELLQRHLVERDLKRKMAKATLVTKKGQKGVWQFKAQWTPAVEQLIRQKNPAVELVLNGMPLAEAVAVFSAQSE